MTFDKINIENKLYNYIWNSIFKTAKEKKFISELMLNTEVLVFGGVVREYILNNLQPLKHRDIDFVVLDFNSQTKRVLEPLIVSINSFGGYKLLLNDKTIDLWKFEDTWAFTKMPLFNNFINYLPETSFFNLNAVALSMNNKELIFTDDFIKFLDDNILDITFKPNPLPALCVVKTFEYYKKYSVEISNNLIKYLKLNCKHHICELEEVQIRHYGEIKYSTSEVSLFLSQYGI